MREHCVGVNLNGLIATNQLSHIFCKLYRMTVERLLVNTCSLRRHVTKVDVVPVVGTHLCFNNLGHTNKGLTVLLWGHTEEFTDFTCDLALTWSPLCSQPVALTKVITQQSVSLSLHVLRLEDQQVIETTKFRHTIHQTNSRFGIGLFQMSQDITEQLTFTGTATCITCPQCDTQCEVTVLHISRSELRNDVLTTACTDVVEQINQCVCTGLASLHTVSGTCFLICDCVNKCVHFHFLSECVFSKLQFDFLSCC